MRRILLLLVLAATQAQAAPALLAHTAGYYLGGGNLTTSAIPTTGATLLTVALANADHGVTPVVTDSQSNSWACLSIDDTLTTDFLCYAWGTGSAALSTSGSATATVTSGYYFSVAFAAWSGTAHYPSNPYSASVSATTNTSGQTCPCTSQAGSITPAAGALVVSALGLNNNNPDTGPWSISSPFTIIDQQQINSGYGGNADAYYVDTAGSAVNPTWSTNGSNSEINVLNAVFLAGSGGARTTSQAFIF